MSHIRWYGPTILLLVTVTAIMIAGPRMARDIAWAHQDERIMMVRNDLHESDVLAELSQAFRKISEVVEPSVVSIEVLGRRPQQRERGGPRGFPGLPPELEEFFDLPDRFERRERNGGRDREREFEQYDVPRPIGNGSGWVYDETGHIVTNNHVIENADQIKVRFSDGREYEARVVGRDPNTDVAVLRIDAGNLHAARIAEGEVQQGEMVFAFGSPFRFEFSMSQGIVSATSRQLQILGPQGYEDFIQTDAAINPGNSGGPLTNIYGEVVGMNTAIASQAANPMAAGFMGVGFAIPSEMVVHVVDQLIEDGQVQRGYIGVYIDDLSREMAETFGYDGEGVLVVDPIEGGPAEAAGIREGDIITHVDGRRVRSADALRHRISRISPGTMVDLRVFRDGEELTLEMELGELPTNGQARRPARQPEAGEDAEEPVETIETLRKLGIESVSTFTRELAEEAGVSHQEGVAVDEVRRNSIAASEGINPGTLIVQVMGQPVSSASQFMELMSGFESGDRVRLRIAQWNPADERWSRRFVLLRIPQD